MQQALRFFYDIYDRDRDGYLSLNELRNFLSDNKFDCQIGQEHAERVMEENDVDLDGKLDFDDFCFIMFGEKGYLDLFYDFDTNRDAFIDFQELRDGMAKLGEEWEDEIIIEIIREHDIDGDGKLNYVEFKNMLKSL